MCIVDYPPQIPSLTTYPKLAILSSVLSTFLWFLTWPVAGVVICDLVSWNKAGNIILGWYVHVPTFNDILSLRIYFLSTNDGVHGTRKGEVRKGADAEEGGMFSGTTNSMVSCNLWHDGHHQAAAGFSSNDNAKQLQQSQGDIQSVASSSSPSLQSYHLPLLLPLSTLYTFSDIGTPPPMHFPITITCLRFLNLTEILLNLITILFTSVQPFPVLFLVTPYASRQSLCSFTLFALPLPTTSATSYTIYIRFNKSSSTMVLY
jgi:hypothetical protein